ncbi:unnamed protein product, partial [Prorocentrum cordatum]
MRIAMAAFDGGRDGVVASHVQRTSVTACALVFGDLRALGAVPHISNARNSPDQDAILELELMVRLEMEASIATLFLDTEEERRSRRRPAPAAGHRSAGPEGAAHGAAACPDVRVFLRAPAGRRHGRRRIRRPRPSSR